MEDSESKNGLKSENICDEICNSGLKLFGLNRRTTKIREVLEEDGKTPMSQVIKILVLGPGDSGKSTILKQMRLIHGHTYSEPEKLKYKPVIVRNIIESVVGLINAMEMFSLDFEEPANEENAEYVLECRNRLNDGMNDWDRNSVKYAAQIESIWNDESIKKCLDQKNLFHVTDSIEYFMTNLKRICAPNYVPNTDDILRARQPTTAIREYKYKIGSSYFLFVDVGGQRSERRKWINCFENVTSLLFVASLSDFDTYLTKDELKASKSEHTDVNRMRDAVNLFKTLINWKKNIYPKEENSRYENGSENVKISQPGRNVKEMLLFEKVSIILFLNKEDLFEGKFGKSSIKVCFDDYDENLSKEASKEFIAHKFIECSPKREIYWHYTFALDRNNINMVVMTVKDRIIKYMLDSMRL